MNESLGEVSNVMPKIYFKNRELIKKKKREKSNVQFQEMLIALINGTGKVTTGWLTVFRVFFTEKEYGIALMKCFDF